MSWLKNFALGIAVALMSFSTSAEHAAVAYVDDGDWGGWAVKSTRKAAEGDAIAGCKKANPGKKCSVAYAVGISRAESNDGSPGLGWSYETKAKAEQLALESCKGAACKTVWTVTNPGFFAIWGAIENGQLADFWLQHGADTGNWALEEGKRGCEKRYGISCELIRLGAIKGKFSVQAASKPPAPAPSCRPKTSTIRCSSKCLNGDCIISYENGCKMRVQVLPQFNGVSWVHPPPSC